MTAPFGPLTGPHGKYANSSPKPYTQATGKATIVDPLETLNNFVKIAADNDVPIRLQGGELLGVGAIRHRDKMMTDNFKVTATITHEWEGKTWLVTSSTQNMDRFYALEVETTLLGTAYFSIVKGKSALATTSTELFGVVFGFIGFLLGLWADVLKAILTAGRQIHDINNGDTVSIWWNEEDSVVYGYVNDDVVTSLSVPRHEIPHNEDSRYFGAVLGVGFPFPGTYLTEIKAEDV